MFSAVRGDGTRRRFLDRVKTSRAVSPCRPRSRRWRRSTADRLTRLKFPESRFLVESDITKYCRGAGEDVVVLPLPLDFTVEPQASGQAVDAQLHHPLLHLVVSEPHVPLKRGGRFSRKAVIPSRASAVRMSSATASASIARPSVSGWP